MADIAESPAIEPLTFLDKAAGSTWQNVGMNDQELKVNPSRVIFFYFIIIIF